ncbi:S24 family peptidase [Rufibacter roseus]|uniref:Helix-turn-helix transcriptional regulator n=1 Tax=Rufibacter roseus TaxID=1567108 RepID=A0ABW2DJN0_9BACT|nr:LexA family transcriptional regulator [Rufibacter roseus]
MSINQRLKFLVETQAGGIDSQFAEKIGISRGLLATYMPSDKNPDKKLGKPGYEVLSKILDTFPEIRSEWLMRGEEPIKKGDESRAHVEIKHSQSDLPLMVTVNDQGEENIVLVDTKAQGGYPTLLQEPEFYKNLPTLKIPHIDTTYGTYRAFEVFGDSMEPTLHHKAAVLGRYVDDWHLGNIKEGYIHVVVTKDHVYIKRVLNRLFEGNLYLMSDNESYSGFPVPKEEVLQLWHVTDGLINKFPNVRYEWRVKMSNMEADIFNLKREMDGLKKQLKK